MGWRRRGDEQVTGDGLQVIDVRLQVAGYRLQIFQWSFGAEEGLELGVGFEDVVGHRAEDVDFKVMVFCVLEGGGDQFEGDAFAALAFGDSGVPDRHPAVAVGFEFQIAGLAFLLDLEAAAGDLGWVVHSGLPCPDDTEPEPPPAPGG